MLCYGSRQCLDHKIPLPSPKLRFWPSLASCTCLIVNTLSHPIHVDRGRDEEKPFAHVLFIQLSKTANLVVA